MPLPSLTRSGQGATSWDSSHLGWLVASGRIGRNFGEGSPVLFDFGCRPRHLFLQIGYDEVIYRHIDYAILISDYSYWSVIQRLVIGGVAALLWPARDLPPGQATGREQAIFAK
jgi:hypothetical protein